MFTPLVVWVLVWVAVWADIWILGGKIGRAKVGHGQRRSRSRMAFGGEIAGGFGGTQQGREAAQERFHFLRIENGRFHLQERAASGHQRRIGFDRALVFRRLLGDGEFRIDFHYLVGICGSNFGSFCGGSSSRICGRLCGEGIASDIPRDTNGTIRGHDDSLLLREVSEVRLQVVRREHYPNDSETSTSI
jgi:hypothetical protein